MEAEQTTTEHFMPYIVVGTAAVVGLGLMALGEARPLTEDVPEGRQNAAEPL